MLAILGPALAIVGTVLAVASVGAHVAGPVFVVGMAITLLYGLRPRRRPHETRVFCNIGRVWIPKVGTIRARDVVGATTARFGNHVTLMLAHKRRKSPVFIEVADEGELRDICKSLGIGHHGFGSVDVPVRQTGADKLRYIVHPATLAVIIAAFLASGETQATLASWATMFGMLAGMVGIITLATPPPKIRVTSSGVYLATKDGQAFAPFSSIKRITLSKDAIVVELRTAEDTSVIWRVDATQATWRRQLASRAELEQLVAQIQAAVDRAHGKFVVKPEPETALAQLRRAEGEPLRAWLARIDTLNIGATAYREASIEEPELWALLEDPEAAADTRAAAARVLARAAPDELKVRVANVLATERNERTRARIAASLDERALELEEEEEHSQVHVLKS